MEPNGCPVPSSNEKSAEPVGIQEDAEVIQWEDFEHEVTRLWSLTAALDEAKQKKLLLQQKLDSLIEAEEESLTRSNELEQMHEKLESQKLVMGNMSMHSKVVEEKVKRQEEKLAVEIRSLLGAGTSLSLASKRLQEAIRLLFGDKGYAHLKHLQKLLRMRQRLLVSQISLLYPVKAVVGCSREHELESFAGISRSGLHLSVLSLTKMSFFTDKKEVQKSASALGYVGHAVSLIASYLQVPLRYPLRLGGSRSYIFDFAPSIEPSSSDLTSLNSTESTSSKPSEFPLFLEGQDTTRAAYAVFLLNKDLEQLLNFVGQKSLGPRHVLANLKELLRAILSPDYV